MDYIQLLVFGCLVGLVPVNKAQMKNTCIADLCSNLPASCYHCNQTDKCNYGDKIDLSCNVTAGSVCSGPRNLTKTFQCR